VEEYTLQVSKTGRRTFLIRCAGDTTFEQIHNVIRERYGYDNSRLYAFFLDNRAWSDNVIASRHDDGVPEDCRANRRTLSSARLCRNQRILYIYDYGDANKIQVLVTNIGQAAGLAPRKPQVTYPKA